MFKFGNLASKLGGEPKEFQTILDFKNANEIEKIMTRSDKELDGFSTVNFDVVETEEKPTRKVGHFHGYLSLDLPTNRPEITQSGYAMFRTLDQPAGLFSEKFWDWTNFNQLALRVKGDNRKYFINLQSDTSLKTDIFQHRLFLNSPGEWETVFVALDDFVMTNWGIIQDEDGLDKSRVKTFGIGLLDKQYGPYSLQIDWVKVMTGGELSKEIHESRKAKKDDFDFFEGAVV